MRGVHVDDHEPLRVLREHVDAVNLAEGEAERLFVGGVNAAKRGAEALYGAGVRRPARVKSVRLGCAGVRVSRPNSAS